MHAPAPLSDCTNVAVQAANTAGSPSAAAKPFTPGAMSTKRVRHNPYLPLLKVEEPLTSPLSLSAQPTPLRWSASDATPFDGSSGGGYPAYPSGASTPYVSYANLPEEVSRTLFAGPTGRPHAGSHNTSIDQQQRTTNATATTKAPTASSTTTTPIKGVGRIYVGGRPMPVRRRHCAEVTVALRGGEAGFFLPDVYAVFPSEVRADGLAGHYVIVEGDRGEDMGKIVSVMRAAVLNGDDDVTVAAEDDAWDAEARGRAALLPKVLRLSTDFDLMRYDQLDEAEESAVLQCRACAQAAGLQVPITIERAVFQFDRQKLTFQYTSESYVDFKALTRMLHNHHKCRIMDQLNRDARAAPQRTAEKRHSHGRGANANRRKQ